MNASTFFVNVIKAHYSPPLTVKYALDSPNTGITWYIKLLANPIEGQLNVGYSNIMKVIKFQCHSMSANFYLYKWM